MNIELKGTTYELSILHDSAAILSTRNVKVGSVECGGSITLERMNDEWQILAHPRPFEGYNIVPLGDKPAKLKHHCAFMQSITNAFNLYMREHPEALEMEVAE